MNQIPIVQYLLEKGANIEAKDFLGQTPLHSICESENRVQAMECLIDHGANIEAKNSNGRTPLHEAAYSDNVEGVNLLLSRGANVKDNKKALRDVPRHYGVRQLLEEAAKAQKQNCFIG